MAKGAKRASDDARASESAPNAGVLGEGVAAVYLPVEAPRPHPKNTRLLLKVVHPDVTRLVMRFGREHHHVDYKRFKQPLLRKPDAVMESPTAKAMRLVKIA